MDCSLPGSSVHGIFQARILEWGAISFSDWLVFVFSFYLVYHKRYGEIPNNLLYNFISGKKDYRKENIKTHD